MQEELLKRDVTVVPEWSIATPAGRLVPDMLLRNGARYIVKTKLGVKAKLCEAMVKLRVIRSMLLKPKAQKY